MSKYPKPASSAALRSTPDDLARASTEDIHYVNINSRVRDLALWPNANNYTAQLYEAFHGVRKIIVTKFYCPLYSLPNGNTPPAIVLKATNLPYATNTGAALGTRSTLGTDLYDHALGVFPFQASQQVGGQDWLLWEAYTPLHAQITTLQAPTTISELALSLWIYDPTAVAGVPNHTAQLYQFDPLVLHDSNSEYDNYYVQLAFISYA